MSYIIYMYNTLTCRIHLHVENDLNIPCMIDISYISIRLLKILPYNHNQGRGTESDSIPK